MPLSEEWPDLPDGIVLGRGPVYVPMRDKVVPMIADALSRTPPVGLDLVGWDWVVVPMQNAMLIGVAVAIRGMDLTGPGKELMQFRPFSTWNPTQAEVDQLVDAIISGLREARQNQARTANGPRLWAS